MSMSFGGGTAGGSAFGAGGSASAGPDLADLQTEGIGFLSIAGDAKLRLLPSPWPADQLPPPSANLLSVASHKGLVAAVGPDAVILATTDAVRKGFEAPSAGDSEIRAFTPQLSIPMPMRISQVIFSADENYLILSAEQGGGLAVYEVQSLLQGSTQTAFEIATNGKSLRAVVANPSPEKADLIALVSTDGQLMLASLKERKAITPFDAYSGITGVSWSSKGKQLVAGAQTGEVYQFTPEGAEMARIPKPPSLMEDCHVSSLSWLENHVFLIAYTPSNFDSSMAPSSQFYVVTRQPPQSYTFQKISEPATPFGLNRSPPHHFVLRLRDFPPNLQDALIVASTASTDVGMFARIKAPDQASGSFALAEAADDARRAQLPMNESMSDTSPIGAALDLSSKEKVVKPIPGDEMNESPTPVPVLMVLNNEGVLAAWWFIYSESVRNGTTYPGLVAAGAQPAQPVQPAQPAPAAQPATFGGGNSTFGSSTFGQPAFGSSTAFGAAPTPGSFGKPAAPAFGAPSALGSTSAAPAFGSSSFGSTSNMGKTASPWGTASTSTGAAPSGATFGQPSFGTPSTPASSAFGSTSMLGSRTSPWGNSASASAFGKPSPFGAPTNNSAFGGAAPGSTASPFATAGSGSGGFSSFADKGGFGSVAQENGGSLFGGKTAPGVFGQPSDTMKDAEMDTGGSFAAPSNEKPSSLFGAGGFTLSTSFKPDADNEPAPKTEDKGSLFGSGFGLSLGDSANQPKNVFGAPSPPADKAVSDAKPAEAPKSLFGSTTPANGLFGNFGSQKPAEPSEPPQQKISTPDEPEKGVAEPVQEPAEEKPAGFAFQLKSDKDDKQPSLGLLQPKQDGKGIDFSLPANDKSSGIDFTQKPQQDSDLKLKFQPKGFDFAQKPEDDSRPKLSVSNTPSIFSFSEKQGENDGEKPKSLFGSSPFGFTMEKESSRQIKQEPESPEIKGEPVDDQTPEAVSAAPLPPDPTSRPTYAAGDTSISSAETEPPLPPDFVTKPTPQEKPIPAEMIPPMDVPGGPEEEDDASEFASEGIEESEEVTDEEEGSDEGSGVDVTQELSPSVGSKTGISPESSFGFPMQSPSGLFRPKPQEAPKSLFGEISSGQKAPFFPQPKLQQSPRSPSPLRSVGQALRSDSRPASAPGMASDILSARTTARPQPTPSAFSRSIGQREEEARSQAVSKAQRESEELQAMLDKEADAMEDHLHSDVMATKILDDFVAIAHQDYVGDAKTSSVPAHVEIVYRDINSMIDTLGLNSRALKSFIKGHTELYKDPGRTREDLDGDDDWCLVEVEDLSSIIEKDLTKQLDAGRVTDVEGKLDDCRELLKDLVRLRAKYEDVKKLITALTDPDQIAIARSQPLSSEQAAQQYDVRRDFATVQKQLAEAEEALTVLKAALASNSARSIGNVPTVEAVVRTIKKLTSMAEKRSGDVDLLENQIRKLQISPTAGSREGSPFATPKKSAARSSTYGLFFSPESSFTSKGTPRSSMHASFASIQSPNRATPPRKKLNGFSEEEKTELKARVTQRRATAARLKVALQRTSGRVQSMDG